MQGCQPICYYAQLFILLLLSAKSRDDRALRCEFHLHCVKRIRSKRQQTNMSFVLLQLLLVCSFGRRWERSSVGASSQSHVNMQSQSLAEEPRDSLQFFREALGMEADRNSRCSRLVRREYFPNPKSIKLSAAGYPTSIQRLMRSNLSLLQSVIRVAFRFSYFAKFAYEKK